MTREGPAKESHDQCGGGGRKRDFFKYSSINGYFKILILQGAGAAVAQTVARRLAVRQARVRISARHPRGGPLPTGSHEDNKRVLDE